MSLIKDLFGKPKKKRDSGETWATFTSLVYEKMPGSFFFHHVDHFHLKQSGKELCVVKVTEGEKVDSLDIRFNSQTRSTVSALIALLALDHYRVILREEYQSFETDLPVGEGNKKMSLVPNPDKTKKKEDLN